MRFLKMNNKNWKRLCKGEVQAKQVEINFKEVDGNMTKEDEGKTVKIISVDSEDERYGIQAGETGEIDLIEPGVVYVLMTTGQGKGGIFPMDESQLEVVEP
ncbi:hypothetical protein [Clostridium sp.]|uniref:hypothetical protein n=1 Tax=Clostridium sp. TaxID=1506 RepID=UPI00284CE974|nr:hypothetical protein [Clostridium sp.]MDR3598425.1 hypothetical protein [Clostridium sp.]